MKVLGVNVGEEPTPPDPISYFAHMCVVVVGGVVRRNEVPDRFGPAPMQERQGAEGGVVDAVAAMDQHDPVRHGLERGPDGGVPAVAAEPHVVVAVPADLPRSM